MCTPYYLSPETGLQITSTKEGRDLAPIAAGTSVQLASLDSDRRTGMTNMPNNEGHDARGNKGTGIQRINDYEGRDLGKNKGSGAQIAGGTIFRK